MNAILTGSMVYGTPHEDSDLDIVVLVDPSSLELIADMADELCEGYVGAPDDETTTDSVIVRAGRFNVIAVTKPEDFATWVKGTAQLKERRVQGGTVTREQAVELFDKLRAEQRQREEVAAGSWQI